MYIAMNRFKVIKGHESEFEQRWLGRDTYLDQLPGFIEFHLLRGPEREDHTLYSSHTVVGEQGSVRGLDAARSNFAPRTVAPATTSRFISVIPNSKASRRSRRSRTRACGTRRLDPRGQHCPPVDLDAIRAALAEQAGWRSRRHRAPA